MAPFGYAMYNYDMNNNGAISLAQSSMQTTQGGTSTSTPNYGINSWGPGSPFGTNVGTGLVQLNRATVATLPQVGGLSIQNYAGHFWTPTYLAAQPAGTNAVFFRDSQLPPLTYYIGLHNNDKFHVLMASQGMNAGITSLVRTVTLSAGSPAATLPAWGGLPGESTNSVVKMRAAAYSSMYGTAASGDPLMLTATYDPSNTAEVIVSAWNTVTGAREGIIRLTVPKADAGDRSIWSFSYAGTAAASYVYLTDESTSTWFQYTLPAPLVPLNPGPNPGPNLPNPGPTAAPACLSQPNFTLPNTALPWACWSSTPSGTACNTGCAAGHAGGYATQCFQGAWQTLSGSCTAVGCSTLSSPSPSNTLGWPTNCTTVPSLPAGASCPATCKAGLTGGVTATCMPGGSWNTSGACANCTVELSAPAEPQAVCYGTTALSTTYAFTAASAQSTVFAATVAGGSCTSPTGLAGPQLSATGVGITCSASTPFAPGVHTISLSATMVAAAPCPASSTPAASVTITVNPAPVAALAVQSITTPCPSDNATATFAFNITGLTEGAGDVDVSATASSSAAGTACSVLGVTQTDDVTAGRSSGLVRVTCRGTYAAGTSVPITVQLLAKQGACVGASADATASTTVACCTASGGAAGASSVAAPTDAAKVSSCWQHGGINVTSCTTSARPSSPPYSWAFVNRGSQAGGVLRAGLQGSCASTADVGVASATCTSTRAIAFNVTVGSGSSITPHFWVGCLPPANITTARTRISGGSSHSTSCFTWRQVPAPGGPASALQPAVTTISGGYASYTWTNALAPAVACDCESLYWSITVMGVYKAPCAAAPRARGRRGLLHLL